MRVYKYEAKATLDDPITVSNMATGPVVFAEMRPLSEAASQRVTLWAQFTGETGVRMFQTYGTGHEIPEGAKHVLTQRDGFFIWHLYEIPPG